MSALIVAVAAWYVVYVLSVLGFQSWHNWKRGR